METNFWKQLATPIIGLSPMDGVTDQPYRHIQMKYGHPDVLYTEFTSVEGVCRGATKLLEDFLYDETQRPIVAQIYGTTPEFFRQTAVILCQLGFDGIDINMGCPAKNVAHSGAGAKLITTPDLALEIIRQTKQGVVDYNNGLRAQDCPDITSKIAEQIELRHNNLPADKKNPRMIPVSVKTRVGFDQKVAVWWAETLLTEKPAAIAMHGRTLKQQYGGSADWEEIAKASEVVKKTDTIFLGNGDVASREDAIAKIEKYKLDGVLIGRASFGNPFIFLPADEQPPIEKRFELAIEHARLFEETYQSKSKYNFLPMRKHLGWYVREIPHAAKIRVELFKTNSAKEVEEVLSKHDLV